MTSAGSRRRPQCRCSTGSTDAGGGADLEDELLLDLDLLDGTLVEFDPDRIETAIALWQRGLVTVEFVRGTASVIYVRIQHANGVRIGRPA